MATILKYQKNKSQEIRIETPIVEFRKVDNIKYNCTIKEDDQLYFMQEYKEAMKIVNGILSLGDDKDKESFNNRILFVGQRGTGKTSAMKSFAKGLDEASDKSKKVFIRLPMVDPSHFDNNTNLLQTVINRMYSEAEGLMENSNSNEDTIAKREQLIKQFDVVTKSLKAIMDTDKPSYTLEGLTEKSKALLMHDEMKKLVAQYIDFYKIVNNKKNDTLYLVLMIDDIDMTVSHAHEMLEELWKYLDVDNLIILMSANLGQLFNEIREHYSKAVKETLKNSDQSLSIDVEDMANKYLLKLFPTSHRVRVEHNVNQLIHTKLEADDVKGELQNAVLSLIWQKTRLLFIPKDADSMLHPIIPTNLRELMQFLDMLTSLKEVKYFEKNTDVHRLFWDTQAYNDCEENVEKFKKYILHNWIPEHLSVEEESVFENIPTDITEINKHLINSINVIGTKHKKRLMSREVSLDMIERNAEDVNIDRDIYTMVSPNDPKFVKANKISDIFNQPSNYSYGDLLLMIDKYETYFESGDDRKFTDAIKIYYTILLFETLFFKSSEVEYRMSSGNYHSNQLKSYIEKCKNENPTDKSITFNIDTYNNEVEDEKIGVIKEKYNSAAEEYNSAVEELKSIEKEFTTNSIDNSVNVNNGNSIDAAKKKLDAAKKKLDAAKETIKDILLKKAVVLGVKEVGTIENGIISTALEKAMKHFDDFIFKEFAFELKDTLEDTFTNEIRNKTIHQIIPIQKLIGGNVYYPNYFEIITDRHFNQKGPSYDAKRAFYHKIKLASNPNTAKGNISCECPLFSVLYYGDIRPDRYETTHIYDTTFDNNAKIDNDYYVTFDMLSIFNNMLNPWQTICRTDHAAYIGAWKKRIENWGDNCTIDEKKKMPNSILPFYSVDIMLRYLKKSFSAKDIVEQKYPVETPVLSITNYNACFSFKAEPSFKVMDQANCTYHDTLVGVWERYKSNNIFQSVDSYRSFVIANILSDFQGSTRDRDMMIKGLHKHKTIAELYKYCVDELYVKDVNEKFKLKIQNEVRKKDAVENYYNRLWGETKEMLGIIGDESISVYSNIFNKAVDCFIKEEY